MNSFCNSLLSVLDYPDISPYIFSIGRFHLRWYSVLYIGGFVLTYFIMRYFAKRGDIRIPVKKIDIFIVFCFICVVTGARLFYIIFYNPWAYINNPLRVFMIWRGGLSFHGGLFGVFIVCYIFARRYKLSYINILDKLSLCAPIALGIGRIGNFLNGELWGRPAGDNLAWAMIFPRAHDGIPRHPSEIYEALGEGLLLALLLWMIFYLLKPRHGVISALFLFGYGVVRFVIEYFREPDEQLGLFILKLSMGQIFCVAMIALSAVWLFAVYKTGFVSYFDYTPSKKIEHEK